MTARPPAPFLTAQWKRLLMLNYEVDPGILFSRVPEGTELDLWNGRCFVSMVGFQFLQTKVLGLGVPFHRDFPEVNLRFYVKRSVGEEVRRGVVFVREIVPKRALAWVANSVYNENYVTLPMQSSEQGDRISYAWKMRGQWCMLQAFSAGEAALPGEGSQEQFITEHYWGYATQRDGSTLEYRVEHPPWRVAAVVGGSLTGDVSGLYGEELTSCLAGEPASGFLAEGSAITVRRGVRIRDPLIHREVSGD